MDSRKPDLDYRELIAAIYAATLPPDDFSALVDQMHDQVGTAIGEINGWNDAYAVLPLIGDTNLESSQLAAIGSHIKTALAIQSELGLDPARTDRTELVVEAIPAAAFVIDDTETVRAQNRLAVELMGEASVLADVVTDTATRRDVRKTIASVQSGRGFEAVPIHHADRESGWSCLIIKRLETDKPSGGGMTVLTFADLAFDDRVQAMMKSAFGLTDAETRVATMLARGIKAERIASQRGVSIQTVRSQIKSIKNKAQVDDLPHLVRLLSGMSVGLPQFATLADATAPNSSGAVTREMLTMRDGRHVECLVQGHPRGRPVILFHNMGYGIELTSGAIRFAVEQKLKFIAAFRPGHSNSTAAPQADRADLLDVVSADTAEMMDHFGVGSAPILSHVAGGAFTMHFAGAYPERVDRIVLTNWAQNWRGDWIKQLSPRHRALSLMLKYTPSIAKLFAGSMLAYIFKKDGKKFGQEACLGSPPDMQAMEDPEISELLIKSVRTALKNGVDAYVQEWPLLETDMTAIAQRFGKPIDVICGVHDRMTPIDFVYQFIADVPAARLTTLEDAGHYLFYSHWRDVFELLIGDTPDLTGTRASEFANVP